MQRRFSPKDSAPELCHGWVRQANEKIGSSLYCSQMRLKKAPFQGFSFLKDIEGRQKANDEPFQE